MAYDAGLEERTELLVKKKENSTRKEMFGRAGYPLHANMRLSVHENDLIVRVNPRQIEELMKQELVKPLDFMGTPMNDLLFVCGGVKESKLSNWLEFAASFVKTHPPKK